MRNIDSQLGEPPIDHMWIWSVIFTLLFMVWSIALEHMQCKVAEEVNVHNVTAADYSVLVTGLGGTVNDRKALLDYAAHYGQVFAAFHLVSVGDALAKCDEVRNPTAGDKACC